jgi:hypothetical protein
MSGTQQQHTLIRLRWRSQVKGIKAASIRVVLCCVGWIDGCVGVTTTTTNWKNKKVVVVVVVQVCALSEAHFVLFVCLFVCFCVTFNRVV